MTDSPTPRPGEREALALLIAQVWYRDPLDPEETDPDDLAEAMRGGYSVLGALDAAGFAVTPRPATDGRA